MHYGVDLGGTKLLFTAYDTDWQPCERQQLPTPANDYDALLTLLARLVNDADTRFGQRGSLGLGFPGIVTEAGRVVAANLPAIHGRLLTQDLTERLTRPVVVDNDANCFLWSELHGGAADGASSALGVTIGTGIGGAVCCRGALHRGANGVAGEIGHVPLPVTLLLKYPDLPMLRCGCGRLACSETLASGSGLTRLYQHLGGERLSGEQIVARYQDKEPRAQVCIDRWLEVLAAMLAAAISTFDPYVVVLGGGLARFEPLYHELPRRLPGHLLPGVTLPAIRGARYGTDAGVRGAALLTLAMNGKDSLS